MPFVSIDGYIVKRETDRAVLVVKAGHEVWIPRSVIDQGEVADVGDTDLSVEQWFAKRTSLDFE